MYAHVGCRDIDATLGTRLSGESPVVIACKRRPERPGCRNPQNSKHVQRWFKPSTAKQASSQGEALATTERANSPVLSTSEDMIMEYIHD
jgi:hypothetical protein